MSTTDGAIDQKLFYDLGGIFYCLLLSTENNCANETSAVNKILFVTFSANQTK